MKCILVTVISFILIDISTTNIICNQPIKFEQNDDILRSNNDTLVFAHVLFRHGDRNIVRQFPNDPYSSEVYWPPGYGQLTNNGKIRLYKLGQYFRRRYNKLLRHHNLVDKIFIQSTDVDRTIMSAQANLAGILSLGEWNDTIQCQPISIHRVPRKLDYILSCGKECPKYNVALEMHLKECPIVQKIYNEHADLFPYLTEKCGLNITTIAHIHCLHNTLEIEKERNMPLADWMEKVIEPNGIVDYIVKFSYRMYTDTKQLARLKSGFLLKEILEHFSQKANSTLSPDRSLWLYSAHDYTVSNMLNSLGLFELHIPPYACSLHFELYKTTENMHYIQLFYRRFAEEKPPPMNIPNCGVKCPLHKFSELYEEIIPSDFDTECSLE